MLPSGPATRICCEMWPAGVSPRPAPLLLSLSGVGLKLNGTHQLHAYADDVNLLGDNIDTIKKNTETLMLVRRLV
jgi:hypothetical protein